MPQSGQDVLAPVAAEPADRVHSVAGFHDESSVVSGRWVAAASRVEFEPRPMSRFMDFWVLSEFYDLSQELAVSVAGRSSTLALPKGWTPASVEIPSGAGRLDFLANKLLPPSQHPGDPRELAVRLRDLTIHADARRHQAVNARYRNAVANAREMLDGRRRVDSTPPALGIDMYGTCNVKPPCVYCGWDEAKAAEGAFVDAPFTTGTLDEWGPIYEHSTQLVNCSIGEPFMMRNIDELFDAFAGGGKRLEITTNGQILTDANIRKIVGRPINLYISFDAATSDTYAVLRNRRFDTMVDNVRRLVTAKGGPGHFPVVNIVFMPMKVNVGELDRFVALCADLRVDYLVLRPLNYLEQGELNWDRAGYRFEYAKELLPFDELVRTSGRAAELCRRAGVVLSDQMDFGGALREQFTQWYDEGRRSVSGGGAESMPAEAPQALAVDPPSAASAAVAESANLGAEHTPACVEPWKSLYILRRGVFPCCYGGKPIASMDGYRDAWNGPLVQEIRQALARGRFHQYCLESPACPVVRKAHAAGETPVSLRDGARSAGLALERAWRKAVWAGQWARIRLRRIATEPGYVRHHAGRVWRRLMGRQR